MNTQNNNDQPSFKEDGKKTITEDNVTKQDVILAAANILIRLGKNDWYGTRSAILNTSKLFEMWQAARPEKYNQNNEPNPQ